jgi:hypothetical protein
MYIHIFLPFGIPLLVALTGFCFFAHDQLRYSGAKSTPLWRIVLILIASLRLPFVLLTVTYFGFLIILSVIGLDILNELSVINIVITLSGFFLVMFTLLVRKEMAYVSRIIDDAKKILYK